MLLKLELELFTNDTISIIIKEMIKEKYQKLINIIKQ